jgi:5-methylcytosine-specific restriction protein A
MFWIEEIFNFVVKWRLLQQNLRRQALPNQGRKAVDWKFYNSKRWRALSKLVEDAEPFCQICGRDATGRLGATDHIMPINKGGGQYDRNNLQRLCVSCHARKSVKDK